MEPTPAGRPVPTSRELCQRALRAHERLYRLIDADEPDLGANFTFTVGQVLLLRCAAADPWPVGADRGAALLDYIETAERVNDSRTAESWFSSFADGVLSRLERRGPADASWRRGVAPRADALEDSAAEHRPDLARR